MWNKTINSSYLLSFLSHCSRHFHCLCFSLIISVIVPADVVLVIFVFVVVFDVVSVFVVDVVFVFLVVSVVVFIIIFVVVCFFLFLQRVGYMEL